MISNMPQDPYMLLSFVNTQLRDRFRDLEACCDYYEIGQDELEERLCKVGYRYDPTKNQFAQR